MRAKRRMETTASYLALASATLETTVSYSLLCVLVLDSASIIQL